MDEINIEKGSTGLEAVTSDGKRYQICYSDEIGFVLEIIFTEFEKEVREWILSTIYKGIENSPRRPFVKREEVDIEGTTTDRIYHEKPNIE